MENEEADNEEGADDQPQDSAQGWAIICHEYPKIKQRAYAARQHDLARGLRSRPRDDATLTDWFALRKQLRQQARKEKGHAKDALDPVEAALGKVLGEGSVVGDKTYVCPDKVCALRATELAGEAPYCELSGLPMEPEN